MPVKWVQDQMDKVKHHGSRRANTDEENKLLDEAKERFENARERKVDFEGTPLNRKWRRYDQIYRNKQWQENVPDDRSTPVLNFTFSLIHSVLNRLTENRPEVLLKPKRSEKDQELADMLMGILQHLWYTNRVQEEKLEEMILPALKYGTSILKTIWDPDMFDDLGDVKYTVVHPANFYPDPRAYDVQSMDFCFVRTPKNIEYFQRRWPEKGPYVIPDEDWKEDEALEGRDHVSPEKSATLTEYWFKDKHGNVCVMYYAGHVVLQILGGEYDELLPGEPVYRHNRFPFSRLVDYPAEKEFWGIGEIEMIELLQKLINSYEAQIIDNTRLMANAQWVVNKVESGLNEEDGWMFDNRPGSVIWTQNDGVRREPGTPIPNHVTNHVHELIQWIEQILGIHDVMQGRRPEGVRAASAIIALQEAASVRIRQKSKHLGATIRDMSEQAMHLVLEYYEEPRTIRIGGGTMPTTTDVREALFGRMMEMADEAGMTPEIVDRAIEEERLPAEPEAPPAREELREGVEPIVMEEVAFPPFDVEVHVGPSVPYSQALLYEQAKEFYQLGIIDRKAVLEVTQFPNKEEILARMEAMEGAVAGAEGGDAEAPGVSPAGRTGPPPAAGGEAIGEMV